MKAVTMTILVILTLTVVNATIATSSPTGEPTFVPTEPTSLPTGVPTSYPTYFLFAGFGDDDVQALASNGRFSCEAYGTTHGKTWTLADKNAVVPYVGFPTTEIQNSYDCELLQRTLIMQYNKATQIIPYNDVIPNRRNTSKVVKVAIRFNDFNGADPIAGIVNLGVDIGMSWKDDYTSWDVSSNCSDFNVNITTPCPTYDVTTIAFDKSALWVPDFQLANDAVPFDQGFPKSLKASVSFSGTTSYIITGQIAYSCNYVLTDFPFDTQQCDAVFSSRSYYDDALSFELDPYANLFTTDASDSAQVTSQGNGFIVMDSFTSPEWNVLRVETGSGSRRSIKVGKNGKTKTYSTLTYSVFIRRYPLYYAYGAIGPTILVTVVAFFCLFAKEIADKMATAITCLLTIMAVQWVVSTQIPVTHDNPWIMQLCTACEGYVGCVCCCIFFLSFVDEVESFWTVNYVVKYIHVTKAEVEADEKQQTAAQNYGDHGPIEVRRTHDAEGNVRVTSTQSRASHSKIGDVENDAKWAAFYGENASRAPADDIGVSIDPPAEGDEEAHGAPGSSRVPVTLLEHLKFLIFPYESVEEPVDEPMPFWLKCIVNLYRPVTVVMHVVNTLRGKPDRMSRHIKFYQLAYDYQSARSALNWSVRLPALGALLFIIVFYLNGVNFTGK